MVKTNLEKAHKRYKDFVDKSRREVKFQVGDEVWLNIKNFRLPEGLSHKFLGPYAGPFKVLEKKLSDTYKLELSENLKVHPTFHVSFLKLVARDASRPNREHTSRPPSDLIRNEPEFEVEVVLKSRQLTGREREYLVMWKGYHAIEASWVNESDMEHAQDVATLVLGSRPRLRGLQGCGPRAKKPGSQGKGIARVRAKRKPGS